MNIQGWHWVVLVVIVILLFGAPKLPGMARSLGQSMRIFKSEVDGLKSDSQKNNTAESAAQSQDNVVSGEVINNPDQNKGTQN
ncbi:Sec-independent protein translocase subunit TatA [Rothia nasimurium]|uniref:Sec-independent protein translocase subunit TatA n=1 Tax=Rothia nasimurium TaxID=85336 RepID=UPI003BA08810